MFLTGLRYLLAWAVFKSGPMGYWYKGLSSDFKMQRWVGILTLLRFRSHSCFYWSLFKLRYCCKVRFISCFGSARVQHVAVLVPVCDIKG